MTDPIDARQSLALCSIPFFFNNFYKIWESGKKTLFFKLDANRYWELELIIAGKSHSVSGNAASVSNYRPISLLSCLEKVPERVIFKHLYNHFRDNDILSPLQSGFTPGDSTTNQLTFPYNTFCKALDSGKEVCVVFCDVSKAFDRVWHKGLLCKLRAAGITGSLQFWLSSYLSERRQRVILPGTQSDWNYIHAGVPQGSILGPLLFLLYINDIVNDIESNIRLFADDTSLFLVVDNPNTAAETLNTDLEKITEWAKTWLVKFNPAKTESLLTSRKIM